MKGGLRDTSMDENKNGFMRFLKWAGIVALVTLPFVVFLKRRRSPEPIPMSVDDNDNIFASELEE